MTMLSLPNTLSSVTQLLTHHRHSLFCHTIEGRLQSINEQGYPAPPRFWMGRTAVGNQWAVRHDLSTQTVEALDTLCHAETPATDLRQPAEQADAIKALLSTEAPIRHEYQGPAYWLPKPTVISPQTTQITTANAALLHRHFADLLEPYPYHEIGPVTAVVEAGSAVAVAFCARIPGQAVEAGVNTHPDFRRRGYAAAVVAAWAQAVYESGCLPLYSTSWDNLASQAVALRVGAVWYGEDWSIS